jgi:hypothetical protein
MLEEEMLGEVITAVPRGPSEWGRLEYQEPWANSRRYPGKWDLLRVVGIAFFGSLIFLMGVTFAIDGDLILAAMYMFPGGLLLVGPADYIIKMRHTIPFRVYSKGLVLPGKEQARSYKEAEYFLPLGKVVRIHVKQDEWQGGPSSFLKVTVLNQYGEEEDRIVSLARGVEVAPIEETLAKVAPNLEVERVE